MDEATRSRLIDEAKKYDINEYNRFTDELGWEDWMNEYTEAEDGEEFTEAEGEAIEQELRAIFREAHKEEYNA